MGSGILIIMEFFMKKLFFICLLFISCCNCGFAQDISFKNFAKNKSTTKAVPQVDEITSLPHQLKRFLAPKQNTVIFRPGYCELVYANGSDMLYAYYASTYSVTVLSGYNQGLQAFYDYRGRLIDGSYDWAYVMTSAGPTMIHQYFDSVVYTSYYDQEVVFY